MYSIIVGIPNLHCGKIEESFGARCTVLYTFSGNIKMLSLGGRRTLQEQL
jgi:hypothetical protein